MENKKATCGVGSTTGSKSNKSIDSVAQQSNEVKQRIMLLHPCDTCTRVSAYAPSHRYHCHEYCPAFQSWARTSLYWISRCIKKSAAKAATLEAEQAK